MPIRPKEIVSFASKPGKNSPSLSAAAPLLRDRLAFLLGGAKEDILETKREKIDPVQK